MVLSRKLLFVVCILLSVLNGCISYSNDEIYYQELEGKSGVFHINRDEHHLVIFGDDIDKLDVEDFFGDFRHDYEILIINEGDPVEKLDHVTLKSIENIITDDGYLIYRYKYRTSNQEELKFLGNDMFSALFTINYLDLYTKDKIIQKIKVRFFVP